MKTAGLVLATILLSIPPSARDSSGEAKTWDFRDRYQITMTRVATQHFPRPIQQGLDLQVLQAEFAPIWGEPIRIRVRAFTPLWG